MSYWSRSFPGLAECLAEVRQFTQMVLGNAPGADLVMVAVSELAGNAIVHTASGKPGGQFVVHLAAFSDRWQVRVDDEGSPTDPRILVPDFSGDVDLDVAWGAESGRGLAMVSAVSQKWGVLGDERARAVWAEIPYPVQNDAAVEAVMSGDTLDAMQAAADAMFADGCGLDQDCTAWDDEDESGPGSEPEAAGLPAAASIADSGDAVGDRGTPVEPEAPVEPTALPPDASATPPQVPPARWPGRVPTDPKVAERYRRAACSAVFMRALIEQAYLETIGPRPLPYWPPFPNPLALQSAVRGGSGSDDHELEGQEAG